MSPVGGVMPPARARSFPNIRFAPCMAYEGRLLRKVNMLGSGGSGRTRLQQLALWGNGDLVRRATKASGLSDFFVGSTIDAEQKK